MLAQRLRRWPNIKTSLFQRVVFAWVLPLQCHKLSWTHLLDNKGHNIECYQSIEQFDNFTVLIIQHENICSIYF